MVEDFTRALAAVDDDSNDDNANGDEGIANPNGGLAIDVMRELDEMRTVMAILPPDVNAANLRKALGEAQLAYTRIRKDLDGLRTEYNKLQNQLAPWTRSRALKAMMSGPLDTAITNVAKKYALFYHLWVPSGIFPLCVFPADFNFDNPMRYQSSEAKAAAYAAEIYLMLPDTLQMQATKYEPFEHLFTSTVNTERANILKPIKDSAGLLFAHLTPALDPASLGDWRKRMNNAAFLSLLKRNPQNADDQYTPLAPILFQDPNKMDVQGLFKNKVLTQMACVLYLGKGVLTGKKRGGPPGRGKKLGGTTTTEGMIATCCTFARFLLSGDEEFSSTGSQTGIPYEKDYEFYIEMLQKPTNKEWSFGVLNYFNDAVFGVDRKVSQQQSSDANADADDPVEAQTRSWEDDMLAQLGGFGMDEGTNSNALAVVNPSSSAATPLSVDHPAQPAADPQAGTTHSAANLGFPDQPTIAMNPITSMAHVPEVVPSISQNIRMAVHAATPAASVPPQTLLTSAAVSPAQSAAMSATSEIYIPLSNLSLGSQPSGSFSTPLDTDIPIVAPVVVPALVSATSAKARSKKGKKADQVGEGVTGVQARATRSRAKRS